MGAVKMITGDHHNIGKELARQIELGVDIRSSEALWPASQARDDLILEADGFAKVKPLDKHEVVAVLQNKGLVDGITRDGLSPIFTAIQISRRIFKRLKSYVIYRICITVQVVFFLATTAILYDLKFKALYIILLALFHDLQIVTIAYDKQVAESKPETPTVLGLILQSYAMGILMFVQTIMLVMQGHLFLTKCNGYPGDGHCYPSVSEVVAYNEKNDKTEM